MLNEEFSGSSIFEAFHKNPSCSIEKVLQSPAHHLSRGAKLSDWAAIIQLKSTRLEQSYRIIQAPEVASFLQGLQKMRSEKTNPGKNKDHC